MKIKPIHKILVKLTQQIHKPIIRTNDTTILNLPNIQNSNKHNVITKCNNTIHMHADSTVINNTYLDYLHSLTAKQLKILCISFMMSYSGNKHILISRILGGDDIGTFVKLNEFIDRNKHYRYLIKCGGFEMIDNKGNEHIYYTNQKIDARKKCYICKAKTFISEYYNEFYKK
jgi:hypothetical protein